MKKTVIFFMSLLISVALENKIHAVELGDIDIHGFISQGYLKTDKNNYLAETQDGTFDFNEMGINFSADPTDLLHIGMQFFARDLGMVGNDEVVLDWAFADYRWQNWMGLRAGKIKIDYGLYNETREMDMLRTSVMLPQSVYPEVWRNSFSAIKGVALYGYLPLGHAGRLAYDVQIGAMEFDEEGGFARTLAPRLNENLQITSIDADYALFGSLRWNTMVPGLKTKVTYYDIEGLEANGDLATMTRGRIIHSLVKYDFTEKDGYVLSLEYTWKNFVLTAEYAQDTFQRVRHPVGEMPAKQERPPGQEIPSEDPSKEGPPKQTSQGWYVSGSYRFKQFELGLSYSEYYPDVNNKKDYMSWLKTTTLSTRFDINDYWILKLETSFNDGFGGINPAGNPTRPVQHWNLFAAKMTFSF